MACLNHIIVACEEDQVKETDKCSTICYCIIISCVACDRATVDWIGIYWFALFRCIMITFVDCLHICHLVLRDTQSQHMHTICVCVCLCVWLVTNYTEIPTIDAISEINFSFHNFFECLHSFDSIIEIPEMKTRIV